MPTLDPFRIFWGSVRNNWNDEVADLFFTAFIEEYADYAEREVDVKSHFFQRIKTLRKHIKPYYDLNGKESPEKIQEQLDKKSNKILHQKRMRKRRETVNRPKICLVS